MAPAGSGWNVTVMPIMQIPAADHAWFPTSGLIFSADGPIFSADDGEWPARNSECSATGGIVAPLRETTE